MAESRAAKPRKRQTATGAARKASGAFSDEEKAAMKERAKEQKAAARRGPRAGKAAGEADALAKIAEMPDGERAMAERLHAIVKETAPELAARTRASRTTSAPRAPVRSP